MALVQTESAYFANAAQQDSFKEIGVDKLEIVGTLDGHTCSTCGAMDGKVIDPGAMQNLELLRRRITHGVVAVLLLLLTKRLEKELQKMQGGTNYGVPADMTFEQWYEKYVKGKGQVMLKVIIKIV